jgi:hypothetical protein
MILEMPEYFTHEELVKEFGRDTKSRMQGGHENYSANRAAGAGMLEDTMLALEESVMPEENAKAYENETQASSH